MKTILGVFSTREDADDALDELEENGYGVKDISIMMKETQHIGQIKDAGIDEIGENTVTGVTTGAAIGGIAGLLVGIGAVTIPGIGAFLIGGPIALALGLTGTAATTITGAVTGGFTGGFLGMLTSLGFSEEVAKTYESYISRGAIILAVPIDTRLEIDEVKSIFVDNKAEQIEIINAYSRNG